MPIKHAKQSGLPADEGDPTQVEPTDWYADHTGDHDPVTVGTGLDVTGQLVELDLSEVAAGGELAGFMDAPTVDATHAGSTHSASTDTHIADAADAHDASAISLDPGAFFADNVQGSLETAEALYGSVVGVIAALTAADIDFTPNGSIAATDVQAAIQEVRDEAGGAGAVSVATVDLTTAEVATLGSAPVEVVAAQGADTILVPVSASLYTTSTEPWGSGTSAFPASLVYGNNDEYPVMRSYYDGVLGLAGSLLTQFAVGLLGNDFADQPGVQIEADDAINQPLSLLIGSAFADPGLSGSILTSSISDAGTGYAVNDEITLLNLALGVPAVLIVDTVNGGGEVLTYHLTDNGTRYSEGENYAQETTDGVGVNFTLTVDSITPLSDGTARLTVLYYVMELL